MNGLFDFDGPINRFCILITDLFLLNLLWVVFSIPIITIGSSTTALYYVCGKKARKESYHVFKDFWKSFKNNFKYATIIWCILLPIFLILGFNIRNMYLLGSKMNWLLILQIILLLFAVVTNIYIFPILSRFDMKISDYFKSAFFFGGRHFIITILCIITFTTVLTVTYITGFFIMFCISTYAVIGSYMFQRIFKKYINEDMNKSKNCENMN